MPGLLRWQGGGPPELVAHEGAGGNATCRGDEAPGSTRNLVEDAEACQDWCMEPPRGTKTEGFSKTSTRFGFDRRAHKDDVCRIWCKRGNVRCPELRAPPDRSPAAHKSACTRCELVNRFPPSAGAQRFKEGSVWESGGVGEGV